METYKTINVGDIVKLRDNKLIGIVTANDSDSDVRVLWINHEPSVRMNSTYSYATSSLNHWKIK